MGKSTAAYIVNNNQLLLLLRDNIPTISDPNKWDTPGGGVEGEESYEECLIRELVEELELNLGSSRLIYLWESITPKGNTEHSYLIKISEFEKSSLILHEGQKMEFFSFDSLAKLELTKHLQNVYLLKGQNIREVLFGKI